MFSKDQVKEMVGIAAADLVSDGMYIGAGTGSTAYWFIKALGQRVAAGLKCKAVPTSNQTRQLLQAQQIPIIELNDFTQLDLVVDGADEIDYQLQLIKGGGGALLQEKMVAFAAVKYVIIADEGKLVDQLGRFAVPLEVIPLGFRLVQRSIELEFDRKATLRLNNWQPYLTDNQHYILDVPFGEITDLRRIQSFLRNIPGIVEDGLFLDMAQEAIIGHSTGKIEVLKRETN